MSESPPPEPVRLPEADRRDWRRHPGDVARLVFRTVALLLLMAVTAVAPAAMRNVSTDLVELAARLPVPLRDGLVGVAQVLILLVPGAALAWLVLRRSAAEVALVVGAAVVGGLVMAGLVDWLDRAAPPEVIEGLPSTWYGGRGFPSTSYLASLVAGATAASPLMDRSWRRMAWAGVWLAVAVRALTATQAPVNLAVTVALGAVVGSAVLVAVGSPRRRPGAASLRTELAAAGLEVQGLAPEDAETGRRTYLGQVDGRVVQVAYLDRDDRDADLLSRAVRSLRVQSIDEDRLTVAPRRRVEHEALMLMLAGRAGVPVPEVRAVAPAPREAALIATDRPSGAPLDSMDADSVSDGALASLWEGVAALHRARLAHRALTRSHVVVDGDDVTLTGFEDARGAADDDQIAADVAEALVATALAVGIDRAVNAAAAAVRPSELTAALRFVQPAALSDRTRHDLRGHKGLVDEVRQQLQARLGVEEVELAELDRVTLMRAVTWVGFAILGYFVLTLVTSWSEISDAMRGIDWPWVIPVALATALMLFAGALSLVGSVTRAVPLGGATLVMVGQNFLNRFTPANAGGMAMRIRYLQKGGTDGVSATAAVGLTSAASGLMQALFFGFFLLWAGTDPTSGLTGGEDGSPLGTIAIVFAVAVGLAVAVLVLAPKWRARLFDVARSTLRRVREDLGELVRRPSKMALLFGGAALAKLATIFAFVASCRAFGIDLSFADLGVRYLAANTVASAVPTPGGVGAIEAALLFVLTGAGVDDATAWAAVLLFRLVNYWLPTLPGWVALRMCERRELV